MVHRVNNLAMKYPYPTGDKTNKIKKLIMGSIRDWGAKNECLTENGLKQIALHSWCA